MKKLVALFISLLVFLSFSCSVCAETYTLHSGVIFGLSWNEVKSLETSAGFEVSDRKDEYGSSRVSFIGTIEGKVAGIEGSRINYLFDKDDKLFAATYWLGSAFTTLEPNYSQIEESLEGKYGTPNNSLLSLFIRLGNEPNDYISSYGLTRRGLPQYYNSWLVKLDDGNYLAIVHYKESVDYITTTNFHIVGYQLYSAEEIAKELSDISDELNQDASQRDDDL